MKKLIRNPIVILMALLPIIASGAYILILGTAVKDVYLWGIPIVRPLEKISVLGVAMLVGTLVCWGFVGAFFARKRATLMQGILIAHIIPFITTIMYTILCAIGSLTDAASVKNAGELIGVLGMGFFNTVGTYVFLITPVKFIEIYLDLIAMVGIFAIGYAIKTAKKKK